MNEAEYWAYYEAVRGDVDKATFCFYANREIHRFAAEDRDNYNRLNANATFWKTALYGMQIGFFMALSRLFDQGRDSHTTERLLSHTVAHPGFFSREAFDARRMQEIPNGVRPDYLDEYVANIWVPSTKDLRDIARMLRPYRQKWGADYGAIRNNVFAHTIMTDRAGVAALFGQTLIADIEDIIYGLHDILRVIWELWHNGRHPNQRNTQYDYKEQIANETRQVLAALTR